ncbi:hypothetical protein LIA77_01567 [Sarocladium implicatum]|nr:hypothetical protein LIA77_01567 [Sarocladium implicatum]
MASSRSTNLNTKAFQEPGSLGLQGAWDRRPFKGDLLHVARALCLGRATIMGASRQALWLLDRSVCEHHSRPGTMTSRGYGGRFAPLNGGARCMRHMIVDVDPLDKRRWELAVGSIESQHHSRLNRETGGG